MGRMVCQLGRRVGGESPGCLRSERKVEKPSFFPAATKASHQSRHVTMLCVTVPPQTVPPLYRRNHARKNQVPSFCPQISPTSTLPLSRRRYLWDDYSSVPAADSRRETERDVQNFAVATSSMRKNPSGSPRPISRRPSTILRKNIQGIAGQNATIYYIIYGDDFDLASRTSSTHRGQKRTNDPIAFRTVSVPPA